MPTIITENVFIELEGQVSIIGREIIFLKEPTDKTGTLMDGRVVSVKEGKWVYTPT